MDVAEAAALLGVVAGFAAIAEMARQRRNSYRPDLAIVGVNLDFHASGSGLPSLALHGDHGKAEATPLERERAQLECVNVGAGAAKQIVGVWKFDVKAFLALVGARRGPNGPTATTAEEILRIKMSNSWECMHSLSTQVKLELPFLLPVSSRSEPYEIELPPSYVHLISLVVYLESVSPGHSGPYVVLPDLPQLHLRLDFRDLEDNKHSADFTIKPRFTMLVRYGEPASPGTSIGHTSLEVTRKAKSGRWTWVGH
jgi:hypothetical protein